MSSTPRSERAAVNTVDIIMAGGVLVAMVALAPVYYRFINMGASEADPFTSLLLQFTFPTLLLALVISVGVSARRGG